MKQLILTVAIYLSLAAQVACGAALSVGDCRLPLMWLPVVLAVTWFRDVRGIVWSAFIGLLADGLSDGRFGVLMVATTLTAALMMSMRPTTITRSSGPLLAWQFAAIGTGLVVTCGLNAVLSEGSSVTLASLPVIAAESALGMAICGFVTIAARCLLPAQQSSNALRY